MVRYCRDVAVTSTTLQNTLPFLKPGQLFQIRTPPSPVTQTGESITTLHSYTPTVGQLVSRRYGSHPAIYLHHDIRSVVIAGEPVDVAQVEFFTIASYTKTSPAFPSQMESWTVGDYHIPLLRDPDNTTPHLDFTGNNRTTHVMAGSLHFMTDDEREYVWNKDCWLVAEYRICDFALDTQMARRYDIPIFLRPVEFRLLLTFAHYYATRDGPRLEALRKLEEERGKPGRKEDDKTNGDYHKAYDAGAGDPIKDIPVVTRIEDAGDYSTYYFADREPMIIINPGPEDEGEMEFDEYWDLSPNRGEPAPPRDIKSWLDAIST